MSVFAFLLFLTSALLTNATTNNTTTAPEVTITTTIKPPASTEIITTVINGTEHKLNVTMARITQPSQHPRLSTTKDARFEQNTTKPKEFIPSPQLETYLEYNRFPVTPALPESKHMYSKNYLPPFKTNSFPSAEEKYGLMTQAHFKPDKVYEPPRPSYYYPNQNYGPPLPSFEASTTERAIIAQDKQLFPPSFEKPFRVEHDFPSLKYYEKFNYGPSSAPNSVLPTVSTFEWLSKIMYPAKPTTISFPQHPYPFVVTDLTRSTAMPSLTAQKTLVGDEGMNMHMMKMAPWKRAAKIFAAILPIGLLISALTPNILTISTINGTNQQLCRKLAGRATDLGLDKASVEKWSKPGCESRLLCETAIREDALDVESVKKIFWKFVSQNAEDSETPIELEVVSNAIREKRCDKISCRQQSSKSKEEDT